MKANLYAKVADFYDFVISKKGEPQDIELFHRLLKDRRKILEIGCGTGRISIPLSN